MTQGPQSEELPIIEPSRPLLIVDVDEVLALFMAGFEKFIARHGLEMRIDRFALFQNIYRPGETTHLQIDEGRALFDAFFAMDPHDIEPAPLAAAALDRLRGGAQIVIFTNAPGACRALRQDWLVRHGFDYPLVLGSGPKGPATARLAEQTRGPVAFVDDLLPNLESVAQEAPRVARFQTVADPRLRPLAPSAPERHERIDDWAVLGGRLAQALGL